MIWITNYNQRKNELVVFGSIISDYLVKEKGLICIGMCELGYVFKRDNKLENIVEESNPFIKLLIWIESEYWKNGGKDEKTYI